MIKPKTILITGGAGYIGSNVASLMLEQGYQVIILDWAATCPQKLTDHPNCSWIQADFADQKVLKLLLEHYHITAVMHLAALASVPESAQKPLLYYENNVSRTIALCGALLKFGSKCGVKNIIFSSTCAVYGLPQELPLTENHPKNPISTYGTTKLMVETVLQDCARVLTSDGGLRSVILRYFNAAGAWDGLGENHEPETHLIPLALRAAYEGSEFTICGTDYDTPDGTAVRDFLHVRDIAQAHLQALQFLEQKRLKHESSFACNLGSGKGYSVKQVLACVEQATTRKISVIQAARRVGDPPLLVADASLAKHVLGWQPVYSDLQTIVASAHEFYSAAIPARSCWSTQLSSFW